MSAAQLLPRDVAQLLIEKLEAHAIKPGEAIAHAKRWHGVAIKGRTRKQVIRGICSAIARPAPVRPQRRRIRFQVTYTIWPPETTDGTEPKEFATEEDVRLRDALDRIARTSLYPVEPILARETDNADRPKYIYILHSTCSRTGDQEERALVIPKHITRASRRRIARLCGVDLNAPEEIPQTEQQA